MAVINEFGMPFNDVGGDRTYSSADWRTYFDGLVVSGVMGAVGNELKVVQQTVPNKTVKIDTGSVFIKGAVRQIDTALNLTIADNTSGNPRIDRVVARLNTTDRKLEFAVKQGTPASSPNAPALTQTATTYELSLAKIAVANGFSTITNANITDERTYMTYRDRVLNDRMDDFEASINADMLALGADVLAVQNNYINNMYLWGMVPSNTVLAQETGPDGRYQNGTAWSDAQSFLCSNGGFYRLTFDISKNAAADARVQVCNEYDYPIAELVQTSASGTFTVDTNVKVSVGSIVKLRISSTGSDGYVKVTNVYIKGTLQNVDAATMQGVTLL